MKDNLEYLNHKRTAEFQLHEQCRDFIYELKRNSSEGSSLAKRKDPSRQMVEVIRILQNFFPEKDGMWIMQCLNNMDSAAELELLEHAKAYESMRENRVQVEQFLADVDTTCPEFIAGRILWLTSLALDGRVAEWDIWLNDLIVASASLLKLLEELRANNSTPDVAPST